MTEKARVKQSLRGKGLFDMFPELLDFLRGDVSGLSEAYEFRDDVTALASRRSKIVSGRYNSRN
jgi:hypothetical protein